MEKKRRKFGFTIVELLTVMAIIAILMGLLVPALNQVRKLAKDVSQKAQFHSIDVALENYYGDNHAYPDSGISETSNIFTVGSQKLAEALVGRDLLGLDPRSTWDAEEDEDEDDIYANETYGSSAQEVTESLTRRQGPYLNVDKVSAFGVGQLYKDPGTVVYPGAWTNSGAAISGGKPAPVLTDIYLAQKITLENSSTTMAGSPILYYKADTFSKSFPDDSNNNMLYDDANDCIYNGEDNEELIKLYQMMRPTAANMHYFDPAYTNSETPAKSGARLFYDTITNPKFVSQPRPYNMNSYILISAGSDGIYGTKDDIYNFEK